MNKGNNAKLAFFSQSINPSKIKQEIPNFFISFTYLFFRISPIGVFFLVAAKVLEVASFADLIGRLGLYFATVVTGLFLHGFGSLSIIYFVAVRKLPFKVIIQLSQVLVTAFGTASR